MSKEKKKDCYQSNTWYYPDNGELPPNNTYVLAHYSGGNWGDDDHQEGCEMKVVKFVRGLSKAEREALPECEAKYTYSGEDEDGNNLRPYRWEEFGPGKWFGQDCDRWMYLPEWEK